MTVLVAPQNEEAEESVIGAMLVGGDRAIREVLDVLEPLGERKFYRESHGRVYARCRDLWADGRTVDPLVVADGLEEGMRSRLAEIVGSTFSTGNVAFHAGIVRDRWARRELAAVGHALVVEAPEADDPLGLAEGRLAAASDLIRRDRVNAVASIGELTTELIRELQEKGNEPAGFDPPLPGFPRLVPGRLYVIGAYTWHGKTVMGVQWARHLCERGVPVTYHTLEMSKGDIRNRVVSTFGVPLAQLDNGIQDRFWPQVLEAGAAVESWPLRIIDDSSVLAADVLRYQRGLRSKVIFIDHLHQMEVAAKHGEHRLALNQQLRAFVALAKNENVAVVALAQLNRRESVSGGAFPRPTTRSLKESGAIEENAAFVGFVWRLTDEDGSPLSRGEWITAKDRFGGPRPAVNLEFDDRSMMFKVAGGNF